MPAADIRSASRAVDARENPLCLSETRNLPPAGRPARSGLTVALGRRGGQASAGERPTGSNAKGMGDSVGEAFRGFSIPNSIRPRGRAITGGRRAERRIEPTCGSAVAIVALATVAALSVCDAPPGWFSAGGRGA
jgi:hypothetical protein